MEMEAPVVAAGEAQSVRTREAGAPYRKLGPRAFPAGPSRHSPEASYWRKFKFPVLAKEYGPITDIHVSPARPHDFAVTSATRVQIYSPVTNTVKRTLGRFKDFAYGGSFRDDGKLLVAGGANPVVQLFDVKSRSILRTFRGHQNAVRVTRFSPDHTHIMSGSDDHTVRLWDIPAQTELLCLRGHADYVRAGTVAPDNANLLVSASYDHTIRLWDVRSGQCTLTINHGSPVEALLVFPGTAAIISAGTNVIKVWDVLGGGRELRSLSNHQKTITSLSFDGTRSRFLSASLDQHVKIYSVSNYQVVHSIKFPAPLLAVALSPDDTHLIAGTTTGMLSIRRREVRQQEQAAAAAAASAQPALHAGMRGYFVRGKGYAGGPDDFRVEARRKPRLNAFNIFLKKFQYRNALDAALENQRPVVVVTLFEELAHRDGLRPALAGRDDVSLAPILRFLLRHIANPRYSAVLLDVCTLVLDLYTPAIGQSMVVDELIAKLRVRIRQEVTFQNSLQTLLGTLDLLFAAAAAGKTGTAAAAATGREVDAASLRASRPDVGMDGVDNDGDDGDDADHEDEDGADNDDDADVDEAHAAHGLPNGDVVAASKPAQHRRAGRTAHTGANGASAEDDNEEDHDAEDEDEDDEDEDDANSDEDGVDLLTGSDDDDGASDADLNVMAAFGLTDDGDAVDGGDDTWAGAAAPSRRGRRLQAVEARESDSDVGSDDDDDDDDDEDEDEDDDRRAPKRRSAQGEDNEDNEDIEDDEDAEDA